MAEAYDSRISRYFWERVRLFDEPEGQLLLLEKYVNRILSVDSLELNLLYRQVDKKTKQIFLGYQNDRNVFRMRLYYVARRWLDEDELDITYTRVYVPFDEEVHWINGRECYRRYSSHKVYGFLAGYPPKDALLAIKEHREKVFRLNSDILQPEAALRIEAILLHRYGHRLGEIFGSEEGWQRFVEYVKEYEISNFGRLLGPEPC